ncbi:MAG: hypothetical protein WDO69_29245 [Pseudomonadota bacterium]
MPTLATSGIPIVLAPLFTLAFLWLSAATGRRLMRWLGVDALGSSAEGVVVAIALGAGMLQFVPFVLALGHVLGVWSLRLALLLLSALLWREIWAIAGRARAEARSALSALRAWWVLALLPAVLSAGLLALAPSTDADGVSYHLTVPKRWLESGTLRYLPTYPYSNTPMGAELLFMIGLAVSGDIATKTMHLAFGLLGALGVYLAGVRLKNSAVGAVAAVLYLVGPCGVVPLLGTAYTEGVIAFGIIGSTLAWLIWLREGQVGWLRCAFVLAGVTITFKLTALVFALVLCGLTCVASWDETKERGALLSVLIKRLPLTLLLALPVLPWLTRSAILTGNPVFPLFVGLIPSRDLSPRLAAAFEQYNRYLIWATRFGMGWSLGTRKLILAVVALGITLAVGVAIVRMRSRFARGIALVLWLGILLQLSAIGLYARYWIPILSVLMLPILWFFSEALSRRWLRPSFIGITLLLSLLAMRSNFAAIDNDLRGTFATALGLEQPNVYLARHLPLYPLYEYANHELPVDAHVLLGYYCGGFHLDRDTYCAEFVQDSLRFTTWNDFVTDARRLGVTHVLAPTSLATGGTPPLTTDSAGPSRLIRVQENEFFTRLLTQHASLLRGASDQGLYSVQIPAPDN